MEKDANAAGAPSRMDLLLVGGDEKNFANLNAVLNRPAKGQFRVDHARSLEEALPLLKRLRYDLLLCDYRAGGPQALHTVYELRQRAPRLPVIFLSDHVNSASVTDSVRAAAQHDDTTN